MQAAIKYELDDIAACKVFVEQLPRDDPESTISQGCILFKEDNFELAFEKYTAAEKVIGFRPDLCYDIALTHYMLGQYDNASKKVNEIIENGKKAHPELCVGMDNSGVDFRSVGNSQALHDSYLVEAYNLKASIAYHFKKSTLNLTKLMQQRNYYKICLPETKSSSIKPPFTTWPSLIWSKTRRVGLKSLASYFNNHHVLPKRLAIC